MDTTVVQKDDFIPFKIHKRPKFDTEMQRLPFPPLTEDQIGFIDDIKSCPSAQRIKFLLDKMEKLKSISYFNDVNGSNPDDVSNGIIDSINATFKEHDYSITKLLDDFHDLKYGKGIDSDDALFDIASDYFKDITTESGCDIDQCPFVQRHYMDRGRRRRDDDHQEDEGDDLLMDTLSMIYCYFIRSHDTTRFTKEERDRIMKMTGSKSWKSVTDAIAGDDAENQIEDDDDSEDEKESTMKALIMNTVTDMLTTKTRRGRSRFQDKEPVDDEETKEELVDFTAISNAVGVEEVVITDALNEYENDRNQLIGDLLDVIYGDNAEDTPIWDKLKVDIKIFRKILHDHFECVHLNTANMLKLCGYIIGRKRLEIDMERLEDVVTSNGIDGRMFDKTDAVHYQNCGGFAKRFKAIPDCKQQHIRQMYNAVRKWKYVEVKVVVEEAKDEEKEEEDVVIQQQSDKPDVYAIGKRFAFWKSESKHPDYVKAKYPNMKEEILQSPLVSQYFPGPSGWNKLMKSVNALIGTKVALKVVSNGRSSYLYGIKKAKPFDSKHLCALKLYTDFTHLCSAICSILRRGDPEEVAQIANWVRTLIETVQCFGDQLSKESAGRTYYRGVNKTFMFLTIDSRFNLPQSTTSDSMKAIEFAEQGADGLVLKVGQSQSKRARKVMKFECEKFSCFPEEKETLFFGGDTELRIKGVMQWTEGKWKHYDKYMGPIDALSRVITNSSVSSLRAHSIHNKAYAQWRMNCIIRDHIQSELSPLKDSQTPKYIRDLVSHQILTREHIRLNFHEIKTGFPWMRYLLKSVDDSHFLDIAKIAILFRHSELITFIVSDGNDLEEDEWESVVQDLGTIQSMALSMVFRFQLSSDEHGLDDMHRIAMGYCYELESPWQCTRNENVLIFEMTTNSAEMDCTEIFQKNTKLLVEDLNHSISAQKEKLDNKKQEDRQKKEDRKDEGFSLSKSGPIGQEHKKVVVTVPAPVQPQPQPVRTVSQNVFVDNSKPKSKEIIMVREDNFGYNMQIDSMTNKTVKRAKARGSMQLDQPALTTSALETFAEHQMEDEAAAINGPADDKVHQRSDTMGSNSSAYRHFMSVD